MKKQKRTSKKAKERAAKIKKAVEKELPNIGCVIKVLKMPKDFNKKGFDKFMKAIGAVKIQGKNPAKEIIENLRKHPLKPH